MTEGGIDGLTAIGLCTIVLAGGVEVVEGAADGDGDTLTGGVTGGITVS